MKNKTKVFWALMLPTLFMLGVLAVVQSWLLIIPWFIATLVIYLGMRQRGKRLNRNLGEG